MKKFMDEDFLLSNETAQRLFHEPAEKMPIIDYHCHIPPSEIAENRKFDNITQVWLGDDHYKWRAIRSNGIPERYITGDASDKEKFEMWAKTLPKALGNPLYHWSHMELKNYFGYDGILNERTWEYVWDLCNERLKDDKLSARGMIDQSNVKLICTTDSPFDDLKYHKRIAADPTCRVKVLPAFRPDGFITLANRRLPNFVKFIEERLHITVRGIEDYQGALGESLKEFVDMGAKVADHGIPKIFYSPASKTELDSIFSRALKGEEISREDDDKFKTAMMLFLGKEYVKYGMGMQLHLGVLRNNNSLMYEKVKYAAGLDCISDGPCAFLLQQLLDAMNTAGALPRTVLYSSNPNDNPVLSSLIGSFQDDTIPGKMQHGAAWWFNDTKLGIEQHMEMLASLSLLGNFIGMLTDSRSFLSYARHEYFRRILCNYIGTQVENGEYPDDMEALGQMVEDISYHNVKRFFGFEIQ